ncbi:MAG: penicillin-binding protein [Bryobacteraceae bacterium]
MKEVHDSGRDLFRLRILVWGGLAWAALIGARLVQLQVIQHDELAGAAAGQQERELSVRPPRGPIVDRNGLALAISVPVYSLGVDAQLLEDPEEAFSLLSRILRVRIESLRAMKAELDAANRGREAAGKQKQRFYWVKRYLSETESDALLEERRPWMALRVESKRVHPQGTLGAAVVGSINAAEQGNSGIEASMDVVLAGEPGRVRVLRDGRRREIDTIETKVAPQPGHGVHLTIDAPLQLYADNELAATVRAYGAASGTLVVMNPANGDVLAMSAYPTFDPDERMKSDRDYRRRRHDAVYLDHDPGSVMKMFTIAAALETTPIRARTVVYCGNGIFRYARNGIIHDTHSHSSLPVEEVLWHSSNVGAIQVGIRVGKENLREYLRRFGFGQRTGIELPGESPGVLKTKWAPYTIYYVSFGHEMTATTIQLAQAASVIANGGYRVPPRLVRGTEDENGAFLASQPPARERAISAATAAEMRRMSEGVILKGTAKSARIDGYTAGGKTGTAQLVDGSSKTYIRRYASTFMGYAPLNKPEVVVVATIQGTSKMAGEVAGPLFSRVASKALRRLGVDPDVPAGDAETPEPPGIPVPEIGPQQTPHRLAKSISSEPVAVGARVPDFSGMAKNEVLRESVVRGMPVEILGDGLARRQEPPPGTVLTSGQTLRVYFVR